MWLPTSFTYKVVSSLCIGFVDVKVSFLIDPTSRMWKFKLINNLFLPHEVAIIKSIPLSTSIPYNRLKFVESSTNQ